MLLPLAEPQTNSSETALLAALRDALAEQLAREEGVRLETLDELRVVPRRFSTVRFLQARTSAGIRRLVAKTTVHHAANRAATERENQAVVEFRVLQRLWPQFQETERCSVPRPVLVLASEVGCDFLNSIYLSTPL